MALSSKTIHPKHSGTGFIPLTPFLKNKKGRDAAGYAACGVLAVQRD
jgi:hypothetical protein